MGTKRSYSSGRYPTVAFLQRAIADNVRARGYWKYRADQMAVRQVLKAIEEVLEFARAVGVVPQHILGELERAGAGARVLFDDGWPANDRLAASEYAMERLEFMRRDPLAHAARLASMASEAADLAVVLSTFAEALAEWARYLLHALREDCNVRLSRCRDGSKGGDCPGLVRRCREVDSVLDGLTRFSLLESAYQKSARDIERGVRKSNKTEG